ncbi:MAG: NAD(P)H-hydrate dehydratase [Candidatus Tectimicrobiota bacterium]
MHHTPTIRVSRVSEMRAMDRAAIEQYGIPEVVLMENAGHAAYAVLEREIGVAGRTVGLLCGNGNNGGDGLVMARKIHSAGGQAQVYIFGDPQAYGAASRLNLEMLTRLPVPVEYQPTLAALSAQLAQCDVLVDALFGTGLSREVSGIYREVIERINASGKPVLSVDIPSGVQGDTGQILGTAVRAHYTATFGLPKIGNLLFPGYALGGKLYVSHISFPQALYTAETLKIARNDPPPLPTRNPDGHKGTFGDTLVIAGAGTYFGAPYLAAMASLKAGGGYARLAAPAAMTPFLAVQGSEIVFVPQRETSASSLALENLPALLELAARVDMVVLGPGLSLHEETQQLVRALVQAIDKPLLLDGDGLTALCGALDLLRQRRSETILTPHLGEMARLTGLSVSAIEANRVDILQQTARDLHAIIVLKGAHSLVGYPDERVYINMSGNSGMATAGSGDVLAGTIAAMYGLGLLVPDAVRKGVFMHGLAGDLAAETNGEDGLTARDILAALPRAVHCDRTGLPPHLQARYAGLQVLP